MARSGPRTAAFCSLVGRRRARVAAPWLAPARALRRTASYVAAHLVEVLAGSADRREFEAAAGATGRPRRADPHARGVGARQRWGARAGSSWRPGQLHRIPAAMDVVDTVEGRGRPRACTRLWCASRWRRFLDAHGDRHWPPGGGAHRRGPLEHHLPRDARRRPCGAAPAATPAAAPLRPRRAARGAPAELALEGTPVRVPTVIAVGDDESVLGVAVLCDGGDTRGGVLARGRPPALGAPGRGGAQPRSSWTRSWRCTRWIGARADSRAMASPRAILSASCAASAGSGSTTRRASCLWWRSSASGWPRTCPSLRSRPWSTATIASAT